MVKSIASSTKSTIFAIKRVKNQKKWKKEEDALLISLARKYNERNWREIASHYINKNPLQCFSRYKRIRPGIKKGTWKKEEDAKIIDLVKKYGCSWSKISKEVKTRNGKQIRDRYLNVLDPSINKEKFTYEEDLFLVKLFNIHGPKWALISKCFPNRTADMVKNRFHSSIKKRINVAFPPLSPETNLNVNSSSTKSLSSFNQNAEEIENLYDITFGHKANNGKIEVNSATISLNEEIDLNFNEANNAFDLRFFEGHFNHNEEDSSEFSWALGDYSMN